MSLSPRGPRGKLRPEWEFGPVLRKHSLAAGPEPVCAGCPLCCLRSGPPPAACSQHRSPKTPGRAPAGALGGKGSLVVAGLDQAPREPGR